MSGDVCLYPYHIEARGLPVYLTGLGGTGYQQPVRRNEGYMWHQVLFCRQGSGVLEVGGERLRVRAGDAFFLPAGVPHGYRAEEARWDVRWFTFDGQGAQALLAQLGLAEPRLLPGAAAMLEPVFSRLLNELTADRLQAPYACSSLVYGCLISLRQRVAEPPEGSSELLSPVLRCIEQHYDRDLSLGELARCAGVTQQHLCRVFRRVMHMRPGEYLAQRRVQAAQELLRESMLPLAEIARRTGFSGSGYFCTVFRRFTGMSPGTYRRLTNG